MAKWPLPDNCTDKVLFTDKVSISSDEIYIRIHRIRKMKDVCSTKRCENFRHLTNTQMNKFFEWKIEWKIACWFCYYFRCDRNGHMLLCSLLICLPVISTTILFRWLFFLLRKVPKKDDRHNHFFFGIFLVCWKQTNYNETAIDDSNLFCHLCFVKHWRSMWNT